MNMITVILIVVVMWLVYALLQSYRRLETELREIRVKCVGAGVGSGSISVDAPQSTSDPMSKMRSNVVSMLQAVQSSI